MNLFEKFIAILQTEMPKPTLYGGAHLFWLAILIGSIVLVCFKCRKLTDKQFKTTLLVIGILLLVFELFKQLVFAYNASTDTWDYYWKQFPFQFCSVPMYVAVIVGCLKESKFRDYLCCFLSTFGLFAGLIVMLYPATILSDVIFKFSQSMLHHTAMVVIATIVIVSGKVKIEHKTILKAIPVFASLVAIAFSMNIIFHSTGNTDSFNMFYIGPYSKCDLPVLSNISASLKIEADYLHFGNFAFLIIYVIGFSLAAYIILLLTMLIKKVSAAFKERKNTTNI